MLKRELGIHSGADAAGLWIDDDDCAFAIAEGCGRDCLKIRRRFGGPARYCDCEQGATDQNECDGTDQHFHCLLSSESVPTVVTQPNRISNALAAKRTVSSETSNHARSVCEV